MGLVTTILPLICIIVGWAMGRTSIAVDREADRKSRFDVSMLPENVMQTDPWNQAVYGNGATTDASRRRPTIVGDTQS